MPQGAYIAGQGRRRPRAKQNVHELTATPNMAEVKAKKASKSAKPTLAEKKKVTKVVNFGMLLTNQEHLYPEKKY